MWITIDINISTKKTSKICLAVVKKLWVLLLSVKNEKLGIRIRKKYMPEEKRQNLTATEKG